MKKRISIFRTAAAAAVFLLSLLVFSGIFTAPSVFFKLQAAPALMRVFAACSAAALLILAAVIVVTLAAGRFYCSFFCPFGILQDIIIFLSRRKSAPVRDFVILRSLIAGITAGLCAGGINYGFLLLDPYSVSGRIMASFSFAGLTALLLIAGLCIWKKRIFCTAVCPVGTLLGVFSKAGIFHLMISDSCIRCGKCVKSCPAGCIDPEKHFIDNGRCIRCMKCMESCPLGSISFRRTGRENFADGERRKFLFSCGVLVSGAVLGFALAKSGLIRTGRKLHILPPGAESMERFSKKCTACMLCKVNCPSGIIVSDGAGPVHLDLDRGVCNYNCKRCSEVCPAGALPVLTLPEKRRIKIAEAKFDPGYCIVFQEGETCGRCAGVCPTGAITLRKNGTPRPVKTALCIGCGACQKVCPAAPRAMTVNAIGKQICI